jgi:hypothetical protein
MFNEDTEQDFEDMAKRWPDLMSKSQQDYLGVGKGWIHILDTLFSLLSYRIERDRAMLKHAMENPGAAVPYSIDELEAMVAREYKRLPVITQIKEKFGALRFYYEGNVAEEVIYYVDFAQAISARTCEVCGAAGEKRNNGWVKTLCDVHHKEREAEFEASKVVPKALKFLEDDE